MNQLIFKVNFLCQNHSKLSHFFFFFSLGNISLGAHVLLLTFFDNFNLQNPLFSKMINFWQLATTSVQKIHTIFSRVILIFSQKILYPSLGKSTTRITINGDKSFMYNFFFQFLFFSTT